MKPKTAVYMRVSTNRQETDSQRSVLREYIRTHNLKPAEVVTYQDKLTGTNTKRPQLQKLLRDIDKGKIHTLIITRLDRLSRNLRDGLDILRKLTDKGIRIVACQQGLDFNGAMGKFLSALFLALSEYERDLTVARIREGLQARREKGLRLGRPRDDKKLAQVAKLHASGKGVSEIAQELNCSRQNVYSLLSRAKDSAA
jgi:DNA invertase Pin-like site-specific DNA recombinase